jgi:hypothetical protein
MYEEFLEAVLKYVKALNQVSKDLDTIENQDMVPYVQFVPVLFGGMLEGFINDEIGGQYSYTPASAAEKEWWKARPGVHAQQV